MKRAVLALLVMGCIDPTLTHCPPLVCPADKVCDDHGGCVFPQQLAECVAMSEGVSCSYPGVSDGACTDGVCRPLGCGNRIITANEVCDDGNTVNGDGCAADCRSDETCGNGILDPAAGEQCDDHNTDGGDGCQGNCLLPRCGDGIVDATLLEACDEGAANSNAPDASCRMNCQLPRCGDGAIDVSRGEVCDDGNQDAGDGCRPDCKSNETCGNALVDFAVGETCDDANLRLFDGCSNCKRERLVTTVAGMTPSPRAYSALAYDAARERVVLFGGYNSGIDNSETWEWDGASWTQQHPAHVPGRRDAHVLVYDPVRHRIVMFGGYSLLGDTWEWDGTDWTNKLPMIAPSNRYFSAAAFDPIRGHIVLYGGYGTSANSDMWEWNGVMWSPITPATSPGARYAHTMVLDPTRNEIVMYGGLASDHHTWIWDGTDWTDRGEAPPTMPQDDALAMAFDPVRGRVVLAGDTADETWEWDGSAWSVVSGGPPPRTFTAMTYDVADAQLVLFGGKATGFLGDTWLRSDTTWTIAPAWTEPSPRFRAAAAYDQLRARVVMFGGAANVPDRHTATADTWEWDGHRWESIVPTASPPPRGGHWMDFDPQSRSIILFAGDHVDGTGTKVVASDLYAYDGMTWTQLPLSTGRQGLRATMMAYDRARARVVTFGGLPNGSHDDVDETWTFDTNGWSLRTPSLVPPARRNSVLAYDPVRERVVMFGGWSSSTGSLRDTWEWDGTTWTDAMTSAPVGGFGIELVFNPDRSCVTLFGNVDGDKRKLWDWNGAEWTEVVLEDDVAQHYRAAIAYDAVRHTYVLFGGRDTAGEPTGTTQRVSYVPNATPEACTSSQIDYDGDGLAGCLDPDCWARCAPLCPPGATCPSSAPKCGDGTCASIEDCKLCPADCGACTGVCGDYHCDQGETVNTCPLDC